MRRARVRAGLMALAAALALGVAVPVAAEAPATVLPANPPTCTAKTLGVSRASNPALAADCDTLLAIQSTLRVSGWINYDTPLWWDHSHPLNWSARSPLKHWRTVTLGGTPQRVIGLDFSDTRESVKVFNARTRRWEASQPYTREWTLRGVVPTQLGNLTALETLDLGGSELTGVVPTQLGALTKLTRLDLGDNKLTGAIPTQLETLTALTSLDLSDNALTGAVPAGLGGLTALTSLDLSDNSLSGNLPEALDALTALTWVRVAGNAFTRCAPHGLWAAASHDLATLGLPNCRPTVSYGAPQTTGVVDAQGEYAFFTATGTAITTYEGLRKDVARLTIHEQDASGKSWAWFYDDVEAGDAFEWRKANDCWVRYAVDEVLADPSATLKSLSVEWMTYAFTGCSGAVPASATGSMNWGALPDLGGTSLAVPVVHGPWQLVPDGWTGATAASEYREPPAYSSLEGIALADIAVARQLPFWRDPDLPAGWTFVQAYSGGVAYPTYGYCALYASDRGFFGVEICGYYVTREKGAGKASWSNGLGAYETRWIAGRPATIDYAPNRLLGSIVMKVYDASTGSAYSITGYDRSLRDGNNLDAIAAIARSLFEEANPQ